jgi:hypothetical protein
MLDLFDCVRRIFQVKDVVAVRANGSQISLCVEFMHGSSGRNRFQVVNVDLCRKPRTVSFAEVEFADEASSPKFL